MIAFASRALAALLFLCSLAVPQQDGARRTGNVFRSEIDALIARLAAAAKVRAGGSAWAPLGGDAAVVTARIVGAMAHCHRYYHVSDGPLLRASIAQLRAAGGDAATAPLVADALAAIDPAGAKAPGAEAGVFAAAVAAVVRDARAGSWPQQIGERAGTRARELAKMPAPPLDEAADVLWQLVVYQAANRELDHAEADRVSPAREHGLAWLLAQQRDGQFAGGGARALPMTGFGLMALQTRPVGSRSPAERAAIDAGCRALLDAQNEDGSFGESLQNYTTCVAIGALKRRGDASFAPALQRAQRALLAFQNVERGGYERADRDYGSIGYGGSQRGDLSNLHFALGALADTGLPANSEAMQKALVFLQRTQNLKSHNDWSGQVPDPDAEGALRNTCAGDDGGAAYYPGNSSAGYDVMPDGRAVPRSYGSMTYALLKAYTLAGLPADDPRVRAAVDWIRRNWTLDRNPGVDPSLGDRAQYQGLFYYYLLMAQALDQMKVDTLQIDGQRVDWRAALRTKLESMQAADGSWTNGGNSRWMEGDALLCTCYALLALERCR